LDHFAFTRYFSQDRLTSQAYGEPKDIITVEQSFMVNEIKFSSRLNKMLTDALASSDPAMYQQAFLEDYQYN
jgi:hypothetical protein